MEENWKREFGDLYPDIEGLEKKLGSSPRIVIFVYSKVQLWWYLMAFVDYSKAVDCVDHNKQWKILKEMGIPDHLIYLLINLYAGQEATVRTDMEQQTGSK